MSLTATIQALHERISRSAFRNLLLWGMLMLIFLFIYGAMAVRGGYHWDETLDFAGQGMYTYLANGRWGLVLWRCIFGHGCAVWLNSLLAGGLLCAAIIVQLRVLRVEHTGAQLVYALLYMLQIQFAYQMDYAYQCDATAAGILATSWAALQLQKGGLRHLFYATAAVLFAIAVYQSLALNFVGHAAKNNGRAIRNCPAHHRQGVLGMRNSTRALVRGKNRAHLAYLRARQRADVLP